MKQREVSEMTLEQKIGHLFIARDYINEEDKQYILDMIRKGALGGVQISHKQIRETFPKEVLATADYPILICADMEQGFPGGKVQLPSQMALSATNQLELAYQFAKETAIEAKNAGYNMVWSPVVDICTAESLEVIRSVGDSAETVSKFANALVRGYQDEGMLATAKHYPGHDDAKEDSHMVAPVSHRTEEELLSKEILPYISTMKESDVSAIMTTHVYYDQIDPEYPASLSEKVISIIRRQGFDGLAITDSLAMMGIINEFGDKGCLGLAIKAGNDLVLPNYRLGFRKSFEYMMQAYEEGVFTEQRLNEAVERVLKAQEKTRKKPSATSLSEEQAKIGETISKQCLVTICNTDEGMQLRRDTKKLFVLLCENEYFRGERETSEVVTYGTKTRASLKSLEQLIQDTFPGAKTLVIPEFPSPVDNEIVLLETNKADEVVFFTYSKYAAYQGDNCITERVRTLIRLNQKLAAVVHMGTPGDLKKFLHAPRVIHGYLGGRCEEYAVQILNGEYLPTAKLPVALD